MDQCFNCGKSKKMYVDKSKGLYTCHSCGVKGNIISLVMNVGGLNFPKALELCYGLKKGPSDIKTIDNDDWEIDFSPFEKRISQEDDKASDPIDLPRYFEPLTKQHSKAWEYLRGRGLSDEVIGSLNLYFWPDANRVVFTIETDGYVMGYMARDILGTQEPKTLNSKNRSGTNWRRSNFWNYDRIKNQETIVIAEGIFSAIKAGPNRSIALLGKTAGPGQVKLLRTTKAKKIVFCLDVGAEDDMIKLYETLSVYYPGKIFAIHFPPVINFKKGVDQSVLDEVNSKLKASIKKLDGSLITVPSKQKEELKKLIKAHNDGIDKLDLSDEAVEFLTVLRKADYKDAGDYSFEEMEEFVKNAKPFRGKSSF